MDRLKISVATRHIKNGKARVLQQSIIALAIKEDQPDIKYVSAGPFGITITRKQSNGSLLRQRWSVTPRAERALFLFDAGSPPKPFQFVSKLIDEKIVKTRTMGTKKKYGTKGKHRQQERVKSDPESRMSV